MWADSLDRRNVTLLRRVQRVMAIRVMGYRTISVDAACVLAGVMPWDLDALSLASVYCRLRGLASGEPVSQARAEEGRVAALELWESRLASPSDGLRLFVQSSANS